MLRSSQRVARPCLRFIRQIPILTRGARTRRNVPSTTTTTTSVPSTQTTTRTPTPTVVTDLDDVLNELTNSDSVQFETSADLLLLDQLNVSRPGTKTDRRYKRQKKTMFQLETFADKTRSLFLFLMKEAEREIFHYPNPDELPLEEDGANATPTTDDLAQSMEFEMKQSGLMDWNVTSERYKRFEVLLRLLENLLQTNGDALLVPLDSLAKVFEMSQYLEDDSLRQRARYLSGKLIYHTRRVEFDPVNESLYIESLMQFDEYKEAERLLLKRASTIDQRWWYELLVVNYVDQSRLDKAEDVVDTIAQKYGDQYLDTRIYILFINSYLNSENFPMAKKWTAKFTAFVTKRGFLVGERQEPGLGASEEATLEYLNREDQPTKEEFLEVVASYLKSTSAYDHADEGDALMLAADLTGFYLNQPGTSSDDVALKLVEFKLHFKTVIVPLLSRMSDRQAVEYITAVFDQFRSMTPLQSEQGDILDDFFHKLGKVGGFERITQEMQMIVNESEGGLNDKAFYNLIVALLKAGREQDAYKVLDNLELSYKRSLELASLDKGSLEEQFVIPPVNTYHYIPFAAYYGRSARIDELKTLMERFEQNYGVYNPALLTQLLNTFSRARRFHDVIRLIKMVVVEDVHKQDELDVGDYRRLYSTIWNCLKDLATEKRKNLDLTLLQSKEYPDYRVVFLKMVEDRVIPSPNDYSTIVKAFVVSLDFYPLPCVLQYMGKVHKCIPTHELLRIVEKLYQRKGKLGKLTKGDISPIYMDKLEKMQLMNREKKSLDPFSPHRQLKEEEDEDLMIQEITRQMRPEREQSTEEELLWRVALAKVMDVLECNGANEGHLRRIHEQFGLVYAMDAIFAPEK